MLRLSFRTKTILGIGLIEAVLLGILIGSVMGFLFDSNEQQILRHAKVTGSTFASVAVNQVISSDLESLQSSVNQLQNNEGVTFVRVLDSAGREIAFAGSTKGISNSEVASGSLNDLQGDVYKVLYPIEKAGQGLATVMIGYDISGLNQTLMSAQQWAVGIAGLEILLVALFSFYLGKYLIREIEKFTKGVRSIERGELNVRLEVTGKDEIALATIAFNSMSERINAVQNRLKDQILELEVTQDLFHRSELRFQSIFDAAPVAILVFSQDCKVVMCNPHAESLFAYAKDELIKKELNELLPEFVRDRHAGYVRKYFENPEVRSMSTNIDVHFKNANGVVVPVEIGLCPIDLPQGKGVLATLSDLTERQRIQREQREIQTRLQLFVDHAPAALTMLDEDLRVVSVSRRCLEDYGLQREELIGQEIFSGMPGHAEYWRMMCNRALGKEISKSEGERFISSDGSWKLLKWEIRPWYKEQGGVGGVVIMTEDLTQQTRAMEASQAKSNFLASTSHEIRTPLNAIIGLTHILSESELNEQQRDQIDKVMSACRNLLSIVNDVLDLAKIEAGELELELVPFALSNLLEDLHGLHTPLAEQKSIVLRPPLMQLSLPEFLKGDVHRLRQILTNLLNNALKFTKHGHIQLSVSGHPITVSDANTWRFRFEVRDTGIGIASDSIDKLFTPFTQADQSTTRRFGGTGLGLSIVKQLIEKMDGKVGVQSTEGQGSLFWFELNFELANAVEMERPGPYFRKKTRLQDSPLTTATKRQSLSGISVLLVDDNNLNLMVAKKILNLRDARVDTATNGEEALSWLEQHHEDVDVVLMDIQMPVMDGKEAVRRMKLDTRFSSIPVIAMTAGALESERKKALDVGMDEYLTKPFDPQVIVDMIWRLTHERRMGRGV